MTAASGMCPAAAPGSNRGALPLLQDQKLEALRGLFSFEQPSRPRSLWRGQGRPRWWAGGQRGCRTVFWGEEPSRCWNR